MVREPSMSLYPSTAIPAPSTFTARLARWSVPLFTGPSRSMIFGRRAMPFRLIGPAHTSASDRAFVIQSACLDTFDPVAQLCRFFKFEMLGELAHLLFHLGEVLVPRLLGHLFHWTLRFHCNRHVVGF